MKSGWFVVFAATAISVHGAAAPAGPIPDLEESVRMFNADFSTVRRAYDMPWSSTSMSRFESLYDTWAKSLEATNYGSLGLQAKIDYVLLQNELTSQRNRLALQRSQLAEINELLSFRTNVHELEQARWQTRSVDGRLAASKVSAVADQAKKLRERVEKSKKAKDKPDDAKKDEDKNAKEPALTKPSPSVARRAANAVNEVRGTLKSWFTFYDGFQPDFSWWVKKPYEEANSALEGYAKYLREEIAELKGKDEDPLIGDPIGSEALLRDIKTEFLPYTPEELIQIGEREFAWCEAEMKKAARDLGHGDDWLAALTAVKNAFAPPGMQDDTVAEFAREATEFVKTNNLVTVSPLCEEAWRITMLSPESQKSMPYVAYGGGAMLVAYAKDEMKHDDKLMAMKGNNRHFTRITTAHELVPGHHLQAFNAQRHRTYRSTFSTPFFVEGWALYWEMRLWDLGYARTPEDRIGMLFWRMHRAARIIVSLKFHLGQMQPKEMVDFLVNRVGHERLGATSEVRRFIAGDYPPLYQCGYMIGGLQLRALHKEVVGAGRMSEREFHDTVLTYGPIPVEMIRAGLLKQELAKDHKSSWKFAE